MKINLTSITVFKGLVYTWKISIQFGGEGINSSRVGKRRFSDLTQQVKTIRRITVRHAETSPKKRNDCIPSLYAQLLFWKSIQNCAIYFNCKKSYTSPKRICFVLPNQFLVLTEIILHLFCYYHDSMMTATMMGMKINKWLFLLLSKLLLWYLRDKLHNNALSSCLELQGDFMVQWSPAANSLSLAKMYEAIRALNTEGKETL